MPDDDKEYQATVTLVWLQVSMQKWPSLDSTVIRWSAYAKFHCTKPHFPEWNIIDLSSNVAIYIIIYREVHARMHFRSVFLANGTFTLCYVNNNIEVFRFLYLFKLDRALSVGFGIVSSLKIQGQTTLHTAWY